MSILSNLQQLLFPAYCPVCGQRLIGEERYICTDCTLLLPRYPLLQTDDNVLLRKLWPSVPIQHAATMFSYVKTSPFHNLLMQMKYRGGQQLAYTLGCWAAIQLDPFQMQEEVDFITPVPLSDKKLRQRGYNQSRSIADGLASQWHLPVMEILSRKDTEQSQKNLNLTQRQENAKGVYTAQIPEKLKGKRILIVDDVFTTGATMANCAQAILKGDPTATLCVITLAYSDN